MLAEPVAAKARQRFAMLESTSMFASSPRPRCGDRGDSNFFWNMNMDEHGASHSPRRLSLESGLTSTRVQYSSADGGFNFTACLCGYKQWQGARGSPQSF